MNVSSVVNHFSTANKGFITTLGSTISAGAVTVPLTSVSGLTNGTIFVGLIEPGLANEQEFTGTVDTAGVQITGVKWTDGTNVDHTAGVTIVDYVAATDWNMNTKGLLVAHDQDGTLKAGAVDVTAVLADSIITEPKLTAGYGLTPVGTIQPFAGRTAPTNWLMCYGQDVSRSTYSTLFNVISPSVGTFTTTIAAPGVVTLAGHGMVTGDQVYLTTTGALPTGLAANTLYYVVYVGTDTFSLATSRANAVAGTKITTTGSQSGTHTLYFCPYGLGNGSTTFTLPDARGRVIAGADAMGGTAASRLTLAQTQGSYGQVGATGGAQGHQLTITELASHNHTIERSPNSVNSNTATNYSTYPSATTQGNTGSTGGDTAHNNVQPTLVTNYIIRA